jgi:hypothetical protein
MILKGSIKREENRARIIFNNVCGEFLEFVLKENVYDDENFSLAVSKSNSIVIEIIKDIEGNIALEDSINIILEEMRRIVAKFVFENKYLDEEVVINKISVERGKILNHG